MTAALLDAACHCGALTLQLATAQSLAALPVRACTCSFCAPRHLRWTADPAGHVTVRLAHADAATTYRFATATAAFYLCRTCGQVLAAVSDDGPRAVINVDALAGAAQLGPAQPLALGDEPPAARLARRARAWTPATVVRPAAPDDAAALCLIARVPLAGVAAFAAYEAAVLPRLAAHGGVLDHRWRSPDGTVEVHVVRFAAPTGLAAFRDDPVRQASAPLLAASGATTELVAMAPVR